MSGNGRIIVDTSKMADALDLVRNGVSKTTDAVGSTNREVSRTTRAVDGTTSAVCETKFAVNAMMAAVVAAEADAAQRVSKNVSTGFLGLISSQLMQKKIEAQTVMQSKCQVLGHFNRQLGRIKTQLENDYQRITARYSKIITQLNENLKSRIYQLDAPAAEVSDEGYLAIDKRLLVSAAPVPLVEQDVLSLSTQVCVTRCKDSCSRALPEVKKFVVQLKKLKKIMDSSVRPVKRDSTGRLSMPVVVIEAEDINVASAKKMDVILGNKEVQTSQANRIRANFDEVKNALKWRTSGSSRDVIVNKINNLADNQGLSERTRNVLQNLVDSSFWQEMEVNG
jgi:hypothetical protein